MPKRLDLRPVVDRQFDVLVIGGGIVGACAARDAARRGLQVVLIEAQDFGGGISWNSLKIVHGGLRSLQSLDVRQARRFMKERRAWLRIAPHLVDPLAFVVPTRGSGRESAMLMRAGLALNDVVSRDRNEGLLPSRRLPGGRVLSRGEVNAMVPELFAAYSGGALFHDAQLYSAERLVYSLVRDAGRAGAIAANHCAAVAPLRVHDALAGVVAEDRLTGERFDIRASMVINAAGAGAASVADMLTGRTGAAPAMRGIALNLMLNGEPPHWAFALAARTDGRMRRLFVVPWRGRTLVGTAHYACERAPATEAELEPFVERFVHELASAWPSRNATRESVLLAHSGMQPSPHGESGSKLYGPPEHLIIDHERDGVPQLLTAIGPKLTTSRWVAEQLVDLVGSRLRRDLEPCDTAIVPLDDAPGEDLPAAVARALSEDHAELPADVVEHLVRWYGTGSARAYETILLLIKSEPALGARVDPGSPVIEAQLRHAAYVEGAESVDDIINRRTELGSTAHATKRAHLMAASALATAREPQAIAVQRPYPGFLPLAPDSRNR